MALTVGCILLQVQRLLELHSYLNGGAKQQAPSSNIDHSSVWRKQQEATAAEVSKAASASLIERDAGHRESCLCCRHRAVSAPAFHSLTLQQKALHQAQVSACEKSLRCFSSAGCCFCPR